MEEPRCPILQPHNTKRRQIEGVIVRRSCMGKKLSFADIRCANEEDLIKVRFARSTWTNDGESTTPFPTKKTDLPYGALVSMELSDPPNEQGVHEVLAWTILQDPKQAAESKATVQNADGISYSHYLRERANRFAQHTIKGQRISEVHVQGVGTKRPRLSSSASTNNGAADQTATMTNDDLQDGGHGDKLAKVLRARIFASWLLETFDSLGTVLDVAGGKGDLSIELAVTGKVPCVVIDPLIRKKHCTNGTTSSFPVKRDAKRIAKAGGPRPRHLATFFNRTTFVERYGKTSNDDEEDACLIQKCDTLLGLHPDQTTQDILEIALSYRKSVAIVPCCVFPSFFPMRQLKDGTYVNTHAQFCQYLCERDDSLKQAVLPFPGRNVVIYRKVEGEVVTGGEGTEAGGDGTEVDDESQPKTNKKKR